MHVTNIMFVVCMPLLNCRLQYIVLYKLYHIKIKQRVIHVFCLYSSYLCTNHWFKPTFSCMSLLQCSVNGGGVLSGGYFVLFAIYSGGDSVLVVIYSGGILS